MAGKKMGRPKINISQKQFESLCGIQCTLEEVCDVLGVSDKTLNAWCKETYDGRTFSEVFREKRAVGKVSLRRFQFQQAEKNVTMAIWLGKQWLGQTDNQVQQIQLVEDDPLSIAFKELTNVQRKTATDSGVSEQ